jgi:hypothetical protein
VWRNHRQGSMKAAVSKRAFAKYAWAVALSVLPVGHVLAASSPTAEITPVPGPGPVVFEYTIERTTEPLSPFNTLPPPLPLENVLKRMHNQKPTTTTKPATPTPTPAPRTRSSSSTVRLEPPRLSAPRSWRIYRPAPTPRPALAPRDVPDVVILQGGKELACRILDDKGNLLRVELANSAIIDLPKRRVVRIQRNPPRK